MGTSDGTASWTISAPYPEGAVRRLADHLSRTGRLHAAYTPSRLLSTLAGTAVSRATGGRGGIGERLLNRPFGSLPDTIEVMPSFELRRVIGNRLPDPLRRRNLFPQLKMRFDARVALDVQDSTGVVLGMPEACLSTFAAATRAIRVFHEVDAHPRAHNTELLKHFPAEELSEELIPEDRVLRIEEEIALADLVLTPSEVVTRQMLDHGVSATKIVQQPYGVDLDLFRPSSVGAAPRATPRALYVGQISRRKGIPMLLAAARAVPEVTMTLVGPVVESDLLHDLPGSARHLGVLPQPDLADVYEQADVLVFPSVEDNFALVVLEAVGAGLPVITTPEVGAAELLQPIDRVLIPAGDVPALISALRDVRVLTHDQRTLRATRIRKQPTIRGWETYARAVVEAVDARRS